MEKHLIQVVNLHEKLRATLGPGLAALADERYVLAHSLMSKLSRALGNELSILSLDELRELSRLYESLPEHISHTPFIAVSC